MAIRQILAFLPTYPDAPPPRFLESAAFVAQALAAKMTASILQLDRDPATWPPSLGAWPVDVPSLMNEAVQQSERNAAELAQALTKLASDYRIAVDIRGSLTSLNGQPRAFVDLARLHDLVVLPVPVSDSFDRGYIEPAIFGAGRPVLLYDARPKY